MIVKHAEYIYGDNDSEVFSVLSSPSQIKGLMKTASYSGEVQDFISDLKEKPGKTYALVNALSAGEYYGSNRNGDYFPERSLEQYHKTFEAMGHVYTHHVNKDPRKAMGSVKFAHYNPKMKRVELILELENEKAASVIQRLEKGDLPAVSMGCRVPFDICSICHNEAAKTADYCDHLKHHMNEVLPGGQKIYAINTRPKFFDLSIITIPADRTAGFLRKLGSSRIRSIGALGEIKESTWTEAFAKTAQFEAKAEIRKKIEGKIEVASLDPKKLILECQKRLSKDVLEKLSEFPMSEILSTMLGLRIVPLRKDFQKLALYAMHNREGAELLEKEGICFIVTDETEAAIPEDISLDNFNEKIAELLRDEVPHMALTKPLVLARGIAKVATLPPTKSRSLYFDPLEESKQQSRVFPTPNKHERSILSRVFFSQAEEPKMTSVRNPMAPMAALGSLYYGYTRIFNDISAAGFNRFIARHP